ncbi:hypothetical protein FRB91_002063 [Serendipita sp. 411]|nr:hypothetical protein FRB91_002063 [Serendipita sp. 411]KAG9029467.1 hypothetical protein FS842_004565 [Serendipita sp. 407]
MGIHTIWFLLLLAGSQVVQSTRYNIQVDNDDNDNNPPDELPPWADVWEGYQPPNSLSVPISRTPLVDTLYLPSYLGKRQEVSSFFTLWFRRR